MRIPCLLGVVLILSLAGCASSGSDADFSRKANQVQAGTPKSEVLKALGSPDKKNFGVAGAPRVGAQPPVTINAGSRFEEWIYLKGDTEYHVFMGPSVTNPGHWEVQSVSANPRGAVAH
jgi:hypothetical protein